MRLLLENKHFVFILALIVIWYGLIFAVPYNALADSLGRVSFYNGVTWPLSFLLVDALAILASAIFVVSVLKERKKGKVSWLWVVAGLFLVFPLLMIWAGLEDIIIDPIGF